MGLALMVWSQNSSAWANGEELNFFGSSESTTEANAQASCTEGATFSVMGANIVGGNSGTATLAFRDAGAAGQQTFNITGTGSNEDTTHTDSLSAGDLFNVAYTDTGSNSTPASLKVNVQFASGHGNFHGSGSFANTNYDVPSATAFIGLAGATTGDGVTTENSVEWLNRGYTSFEALQVRVTTNARTNNSDFKNRINSADGSLLCQFTTGATGLISDTSPADTITDGQTINASITLGTGVEDLFVTFVVATLKSSSNKSESFAGNNAGLLRTASSTANYFSIGGMLTTTNVTEAQARIKVGFAAVASNLRTYLSANTYTGTGATEGTLKCFLNGVSALSVPITASGGAGWYENTADSVTIDADDVLSFEFDEGTSGSITIHSVGITFAPAGTSPTKTATLDSAIQAARQMTGTIEAAIAEQRAAAATLDAAMAITRSATASVDSAILAAISASAATDAAIRDTRATSAAVDVAIAERREHLSTLDAAIAEARTATAILDAAIRAARAATTSLDAAISASRVVSSSLDAALAASFSKSATLDAMIFVAAGLTASLDAAIAALRTSSTSMDAAIALTRSLGSSLDAAIAATRSASAFADAAIRDARSIVASLESAIEERRSSGAALDASIIEAIETTRTAILDAAIRAVRSITTLADAVISAARAASTASDAAILAQRSATAALSVAIRARIAISASADAVIVGGRTASATIDAMLARSEAISISADAVLLARLSVSANIAAAIRAAIAISGTVDAFISAVATAPHDERGKIQLERDLDEAMMDFVQPAPPADDSMDF